MWKFHVLFFVLVFFSVKGTSLFTDYYEPSDTPDPTESYESGAAYDDVDYTNTVWTAGSAVNVNFGPEDALYCKLKDNNQRPVFDGFGPCRVVVDRVTMAHRGYWDLWIGIPGKVIVRSLYVYVDVVEAVATTPADVTGSVIVQGSTVILQCTVPEEHEIMTCTFRNPFGSTFIATREVNQEGYNNDIRYESFVDRHKCSLTLLSPLLESPGIWRCSVNSTQATSHGFFVLKKSMLDQDYMHDHSYYGRPELQSTFSAISGMVGDAKTLTCSIAAAVRYCYFRAPNGTVFNVGPSTSSPGYEYVGIGFDAGECGIRFNNIRASDEGLWSCSVGLKANFEERRAFFNVYVYKRLVVKHLWSASSLVVHLRIFHEPKLEYCRFVRSDGLGFSSDHVPPQYVLERGELYGTCAITIPNPTAEDLRPWTIVAKVIGEDGEVSMTTILDSRGQPTRRLSSKAAILLWSFFGTIFAFLTVVSCLPKKNREWTYQRGAQIRNSFRRQHHQGQRQQQNVTDLPKPVHTDILTDLPPKF